MSDTQQKRCRNCLLFYEDADQTCRFHPGAYKTRPGNGVHMPEWSCCVHSDNFKPMTSKFSKLPDQFHGCCIARQHVEDESYTKRLNNFTNSGQINAAPDPTITESPRTNPALLDIPVFPRRNKLQPLADAQICGHCNEKFNFLSRRRNCTWCGQVFCPRCCFASRPMEIVGVEWGLVCKGCLPIVNHEAYLFQTRKWTSVDRPTTRNYWAWRDYMDSIHWKALQGVFRYKGGMLESKDLTYKSPFLDPESPVYSPPVPQKSGSSNSNTTPGAASDSESSSSEGDDYVAPQLPAEKTEAELETPDGSAKVRAGDAPDVVVKDGVALFPHQVQTNETLVGLSLKYGVSVKQIQTVNRLADHKIITRKQLLIPLHPDQLVDPNFSVAPSSRRHQVLALKKRIQGSYEEADFYLMEANDDIEAAFKQWQEDREWEQLNKPPSPDRKNTSEPESSGRGSKPPSSSSHSNSKATKKGKSKQ